MAVDRTRRRRRSIRLPGYDYSSPGPYFVTICVRGGEALLGEVVDGKMLLNERGQTAAQTWLWLAAQYPYVSLDAWVVMPNHTHGIITIGEEDNDTDGIGRDGSRGRGGSRGTGGSRTAPTVVSPTKRKPLGRLVGAYKTVSTKRINEMQGTAGIPFWQRNYWEHIIRSEGSLNRIREYVQDNPARWQEDQMHPNAQANPFNQWS